MPLEWNVSIFNNCTDHYRISVQKKYKIIWLGFRAARRALAMRQPHDLDESAESADTAAILFELAISATVSSQLLQLHTAQCPSQPAAERTFFAVPSMSGRGGGCARGPNGGA
jgi:hypothetical protein